MVYVYDPVNSVDAISGIPKQVQKFINLLSFKNVSIMRGFGGVQGMDCFKRCLNFAAHLLDGEKLENIRPWTKL